MSLSDIYKTVFKKAIFYKGKPNQINIADGSDLRLFTILTSGIFATKEMSEMCKKWGVAQGLSKLKIICFDSVLQLPRGREWVDQVRNRPINLNGMNEEKFESYPFQFENVDSCMIFVSQCTLDGVISPDQ